LTLGVNLFEARIEANAESVCESVATTAWDPSRVELHRGTASRPRVGREVNVRMSPDSVGAFAQRILADRSLADDRQAEQLAQGELDRRVASEVTLWGVADGDARLCPGTAVVVSGVDGTRAAGFFFALTSKLQRRFGKRHWAIDRWIGRHRYGFRVFAMHGFPLVRLSKGTRTGPVRILRGCVTLGIPSAVQHSAHKRP
jgi:hypothetical protein